MLSNKNVNYIIYYKIKKISLYIKNLAFRILCRLQNTFKKFNPPPKKKITLFESIECIKFDHQIDNYE